MPGRRLYTLHPPLSRNRRTFLSLPRSHRSGYLLRKDLHFQKENKSQHFSGGSSRRYQGGRRWHLVGDLYGLRSWFDLEEKTLQPLKNPFGPKVYVSGTFCKGCLRTAQTLQGWTSGIRTRARQQSVSYDSLETQKCQSIFSVTAHQTQSAQTDQN